MGSGVGGGAVEKEMGGGGRRAGPRVEGQGRALGMNDRLVHDSCLTLRSVSGMT